MLHWILFITFASQAPQAGPSLQALTSACDTGSHEACVQMAASLERSCRQHDLHACTLWATALHDGRGTPRDVPRSLALFAVACEARETSGEACARNAALVDEDTGPVVRARLLGDLCDAGVAEACASLGRIHMRGGEAPRDGGRAVVLFQRACEGGAAIGCYRLARAYEQGRDAPRDERASRDLLRRACDGHLDLACVQLAVSTHPPAPDDRLRGLANLLRDLDSPDGDLGARAAEAIEKIGPPALEAIPALLEATGDRSWILQNRAESALAAIGPPPDVQGARDMTRRALAALLERPDRPRDYSTAALFKALGVYGEAAVPDLVRHLVHDTDAWTCQLAASALGSIGPAAGAAVDSLIAAKKEGAKAKDRALEQAAAIAIARISPDNAAQFMPLLVATLRHGADVNVDAIEAAVLVIRGGRPDVGGPLLVAVSRDTDQFPTTRLRALSALAGEAVTARRWALDALRAAIADPDVAIRDAAVSALAAVAPNDAPGIIAAARERERVLALPRPGRRPPRGPVGDAIRRLSSADPRTRVAAVRELGVHPNPAAIPWLIAVLGDDVPVSTGGESPDTSPGMVAADAIASCGAVAVEALGDVLMTGSPLVRQDAAASLGLIAGARAVELLRAAVVDHRQSSEVRRAVVAALGAVASEEAREALRHTDGLRAVVEMYGLRLGEPLVAGRWGETPARPGSDGALDALAAVVDDPELRSDAIYLLTDVHDRRAVPALLEDLESAEPARADAAGRLAAVPDARNVAPLLRVTDARCAPSGTGPRADLCANAAIALAATGDVRALPPLLDALESTGKDYDWQYRIASAMASLGEPGWRALVESISAERPARRVGAVRALSCLAEWRERRGLEAMLARLAIEREAEVRNAIVRALGYYRGPARVDALLAALRDPVTRRTAADALDRSGDWRAVGPLVDLLADADAPLASAVFSALASTTGQNFGANAAAWRSWWEATRPRWQKEQAFRSRTLRIVGRLVDSAGKPVAGQLVRAGLASRGESGPPIGGAWSSSCGADAFGNMLMFREARVPVSPGAFTDEHGEFELFDRRHLLEAGKDQVLFVVRGGRCSRLLALGQPSFRVGLDDEVIRLGDLTLKEER